MDLEVGQTGNVARISYVSADQRTAYFEFKNGTTANFTSEQTLDLSEGDVILISLDGKSYTKATKELWPNESWIGIVKLHNDKRTLVDISGRFKEVDVPEGIELRVGNTVKGQDSQVNEVVSEEPIRYIDLPTIDDHTLEQFKPRLDGKLDFDDFGGFPEIVARARQLIETPLEHQEALIEIGTKPIKGVLFTGPPGTGKTMLARIIAHQAKAQFYEISGPQILSKWYGQSEELIRKLFDDASKQERAIIFFDELDSLATQRADDSHEASRRVVGQLLASIDGFKTNANVIVIGTTNRPQDIDVALRRPGRFDWEINFPLPNKNDREAILLTSSKKLGTKKDLPHQIIAEKTEGWSAADLVAIWTEAALLCVTDGRKQLASEDYLGGFERVSDQRTQITNSVSTKSNEGRG